MVVQVDGEVGINSDSTEDDSKSPGVAKSVTKSWFIRADPAPVA